MTSLEHYSHTAPIDLAEDSGHGGEKAPFVAVVTGSSSGIGQAIAIEFAARGASLLLHGRSNLAGIEQTVKAIQLLEPKSDAPQYKWQGTQEQPRVIMADIQCPHAAYSLVQSAFAWKGYVNVWVHAAGADVLTGESRGWSFERKLRELWATDVQSTLMLSRLVARYMLHQNLPQRILPSMVHLGWDQADEGMEGDSGQYFCAVKSAVSAFSKSLAKSYAPRIRVNCILPGWIKTDWGASTSVEWSERACGESLLDRWGTPEDVARITVAISMGDGEFLNGQSIALNGGRNAGSWTARSHVTHDHRPNVWPLS